MDTHEDNKESRNNSRTPEQRRRHAQMAAYAMHSKHDPRETTRAARAGFLARFEREVDPAGVLPPAERTRRAEAAKQSYMLKLAMKSAAARRRSQ